jgi:type I restriction enzyme S subunit
MELLKEKRQAVISHAVTRGLNPAAPLKPSGIEWLGDVPTHWEVMTLRRCATYVQTGGTPSSEPPSADLEEGLVWFTPGDFGDALRLTASTRKISPAVVASGEAKVFPPRSVLVVSIGATLGKVGFAEEASSANQQINAVIPNERIDGYFLAYSLLVKAEVMRFLSNASTIGIMNQEKTKDIWIAVPPSTEQAGIAAFLDSELAKLDTLTAEAQRAIALLQERRTALISAAVTGQIDVRQLAEKKAA